MSINGFLSDRSLIDSSRSTVNLETLNLPCGYLDRKTIEYFVAPLEVIDLRPARLSLAYRQETGVVAEPDRDVLYDTLSSIFEDGAAHIITNPTETVTSAEYYGLDYLEFGNDVLPSGLTSINVSREMLFTLDNSVLTPDEAAAFHDITLAEQERLFNIIEYLVYGTIVNDRTPDIDSVLISDGKYLGYVASSVVLSTLHSPVFIFGGVNVHRAVPNSIQFVFVIGSHTVKIKLWFNKNAFLIEYPITTILTVVPPLDLNILLNPASLADPIDSAIMSQRWSDAILQPELTNVDQTGMYLFTTRYIYNTKNYQAIFSIVYRGKAPDSMQARNYIANYLLSSGIGTRALWEIILPDIFYHSAFALVPFYDNITVLTNADIYPSIINILPLMTKLNSVVAVLPNAINPSRELMSAAYDKFFIGVAPSDVNENNSLLNLHPTYQSFSTTDIGFTEMTNNDREWSIKLNQAISVATGETNILTFNKVEFGNLIWVNFVLDYVSYLILTKESYKKHFNLV